LAHDDVMMTKLTICVKSAFHSKSWTRDYYLVITSSRDEWNAAFIITMGFIWLTQNHNRVLR